MAKGLPSLLLFEGEVFFKFQRVKEREKERNERDFRDLSPPLFKNVASPLARKLGDFKVGEVDKKARKIETKNERERESKRREGGERER